MYKTIGIIGGMGPAATADLMMKIINRTEASCDQEHIPLIIDSNTRIPDRTNALIKNGPDPFPEILASAKRLAAAGADILLLACNTAHSFITRIEQEIDIPFISMPAETANVLKDYDVKTAAVLATDGTLYVEIYDRVLREKGIEPLYPSSEQQKLIMSLIYDYIKKGITSSAELPYKEVRKMLEDLKSRGAEVYILACTELPIAFSSMRIETDDCVDPTIVLVEAAIRRAGGKVIE